MIPNFESGSLIRAGLVFIGVFIIVLIVRYLIIRDLDFGFAFIIAVLLLFIYFVIQRLFRYVRSKEV